MTGSTPPPRLGIYVHVPFCIRRCGYCAFATTAVGERLEPATEERFVATTLQEIRLAAEDTGGATTLYLGGGTPSMLSPSSVAALVDAARMDLGLLSDAEITIEANPDGLRSGQLHELLDAGVNRISFGFQSVRRSVLQLLDRTHDPERALAAVGEARAAGFEHIGIDLIHGTPGETADDFAASLAAAIDSGVDHISAYALGIEPGTKLAARVRSGELPRPDDDAAADRYVAADQMLSRAGFEWYELSNWARSPSARSAHNLIYWRNGDWVGIGPSAHSHRDGVRWRSPNAVGDWESAVRAGAPERLDVEALSQSQQDLERVMLGVRLAEGIPTDGLIADDVAAVVDLGLGEHFTDERGDERLRLTLRGRLLADSVVLQLVG